MTASEVLHKSGTKPNMNVRWRHCSPQNNVATGFPRFSPNADSVYGFIGKVLASDLGPQRAKWQAKEAVNSFLPTSYSVINNGGETPEEVLRKNVEIKASVKAGSWQLWRESHFGIPAVSLFDFVAIGITDAATRWTVLLDRKGYWYARTPIATVQVSPLLQRERDRQRLWERLDRSFAHEPLEPDRDHPAERTLSQALFIPQARRWLVEFCADDGHAELASSLLLCLGRQPSPALVEWEEHLITRALASNDVEIRDAAVQLAESWGGVHLLSVLQSHQESEDWLQDYIRSVLADWSI